MSNDTPYTQVARDVIAERLRQISEEGWTPDHDDEHRHGELPLAAACYAVSGSLQWRDEPEKPFPLWPFSAKWWKPTDRRRSLVKAGALILAEIERIDRAAAREGA